MKKKTIFDEIYIDESLIIRNSFYNWWKIKFEKVI